MIPENTLFNDSKNGFLQDKVDGPVLECRNQTAPALDLPA